MSTFSQTTKKAEWNGVRTDCITLTISPEQFIPLGIVSVKYVHCLYFTSYNNDINETVCRTFV